MEPKKKYAAEARRKLGNAVRFRAKHDPGKLVIS